MIARQSAVQAGGGRRCVVLMYHIVDSPRSDAERQWCCEPERFREQMRHLREAGYAPIGMDRLHAWMTGAADLPQRAVCVTFDDGTRCLRSTALPILREFDVPATAYVVAGLLGGDNRWVRPLGWSHRGLVDAADLRELLANGVEIGSHSLTHADLLASDDALVTREVTESRAILEDVLGRDVRHFAYPFGRLRPGVRDRVREAGYATACCVTDGIVRRHDDPLLLNRVEVYHWDDLARFERKVRWGIADPTPTLQTFKRIARRTVHRLGLQRHQQA